MRIENILNENFFRDAEDNWIKDEASLAANHYLELLQDEDKEYADNDLLREIQHMKKHFSEDEFQQYLGFIKSKVLSQSPDLELPF